MKTLFYFIEVSICAALFYGLYYILFRRTTFFLGNRIYLLGSLTVAFIIPLIDFQITTDIHQTAIDYVVTEGVRESITVLDLPEPKQAGGIGVHDVLVVVYWLGVLFFTIQFLYASVRVLRLRRCSAPVSVVDGCHIFRADIEQPFCFFHFIFLPRDEVNHVIVQHEKAHVQKLHWLDLVAVEFCSALLWFNPIMIFFRRSLKLQHEYEADACTLDKGFPLEEYLDAILVHLKGAHATGPISQFSSTHIKNRIIMMTQEKTNPKHVFLYLFSLPLCVLLLSFSSTSVETATSLDPDSDFVVVLDPGHGAHDAGASSSDGVFEKEVVLNIAKQIQEILRSKKIGVVLTRDGDKGVSLSQRVSVAQLNKADLFVSLHAGYDEADPSTSGIHCIISKDNYSTVEESKRFAEGVIQHLDNIKGMAVKGIKTSDAYVLRNNTIPAIVMDLGFLSNDHDKAFLKNPGNLARLSQSIADAIVHHSK
jgi:N-acetylmuramoyl-L-alanine amidase